MRLAVALIGGLALAVQAKRGDLVFETGFEGAEPLKGWQGVDPAAVRVGPGPGGSPAVFIEQRNPGGSRLLRLALPVEKMRGARLRCRARVKAEDVGPPPQPWNGVKFVLRLVSPDGTRWPQRNGVVGTFDWKTVEFKANVPRELTEAWLILGLEAVTGRAGFDDLRITVDVPPRERPERPPAGPPYRGHDLPRLRGAMISPHVTEADLRVLGGEWKANHVRWQLCWGGFPRSPADNGDLAAYDRWLEGALERLDRLLPVCEELGLLVLVDLHTPPGGRNDAHECRLFHEKRFQDRFLDLWEGIARRYRGKRAVWGYDLVNEPVEGDVGEGLMDWPQLAEAAARRIRAVDPDHALVVEPAPWGGPEALTHFAPIGVSKVVYSVHMYLPHKFTHQGVFDNPRGPTYPGVIDGVRWDKERLRLALRPALEFQRDYGVHIYIGEFSAIRWAPGESARDYLRDVIEILEEYGWDWAYHAFREWDGWSVEHGPDPQDRSRAKTPTSRQELLCSWYAKNRKPSFGREGR